MAKKRGRPHKKARRPRNLNSLGDDLHNVNLEGAANIPSKKIAVPRKKYIALDTHEGDKEYFVGGQREIARKVSAWLDGGQSPDCIEVYELGVKVKFEQKVTLNVPREKKSDPEIIESPFGEE